MDLQTDESAGMSLVDLLVDDVFHVLPVDPRLDARSTGNNPNLVPAVVDEVRMPLLDFLLRRQPIGAHRFAVDMASRRQALVGATNLHLRTVHAPGSRFEGTPLHRDRSDLRSNLNAGIGDRIDGRLQFKLE